MSICSDGAPAPRKDGKWTTQLDAGFDQYPMEYPPSLGQPKKTMSERKRRHYVEGPRWLSTRAAVWLKYVAYALAVFALCAATEGLLSGVPTARHGGQWMLFSVALLCLAAMFGLWRYPPHRNEIVKQARHYIFGIMVIPGTALAAVMWAAGQFFVDSASNSQVFGMMMGTALPIVFFVTVVVPLLVYVKLVAGMRYMFRTREDDQETMSVYTRQDHISR